MKGFFAVVVGMAVFFSVGLSAAVADPTLGEKLERDMWADIERQNWGAMEGRIAEGFQSVHQDGARGKAEEMRLLRNLHLGEYTLSDFKVTRTGPVMVVTYFVSVEEQIKGKVLPTQPAARQSVWLQTDQGWQWVSHANLNPMK